MFKRKLSALNYCLADSFDAHDECSVRNLILWLEDQKIRLYTVENRVGLRQTENNEIWFKAVNQYLSDLKCPHRLGQNFEDRNVVIDWLLSFAVKYEFIDNAEFYKSKLTQNFAQKSNSGKLIVSQNPLDDLNFEDTEFRHGVEKLATLLSITRHPDHLITLKAVSKFVSDRLTKAAIDEAVENPKKDATPVKIKLEDFDAGFDCGDYVLNNAAKILRLLHVRELRNLQTHINETIVNLQQISADPKTDERLGKVGI